MGKEKLILIAILVLGLVLRLIKIDQSFWLDEASQAQLSSKSVTQIWSNRQADFHPPLFYILSHYWLQLGRSEPWLRLLPITFGVANVYALYLLAKQIHPKLGLMAAFLLAINPFHVYYSQEFRMYSLLALLGTLSMLAYYKKHWSLFIVNTLLLYTHYSSILLIVTQFVHTLIFSRERFMYLIKHFVLSILLYLPWLPRFLDQLHGGVNIDTYLPGWRNILTLTPLKAIPLILFKFTAGRINLLPKYVYAIYITFVLTVTSLGILLARGKRRLLYVWLAVPIIGSLLLSFYIPQTQPFRLIFTLPALVLLLAETSTRFPRLFLGLVVYISIVGNFTYFTRPRLQREQWRQALEFVRSQPATMVVKFSGPFAPMIWYAPDLPVVTASFLPSQQNSLYLFQYLSDLTDPSREVDAHIASLGFKMAKRYNFEGVGFVDYYQK